MSDANTQKKIERICIMIGTVSITAVVAATALAIAVEVLRMAFGP